MKVILMTYIHFISVQRRNSCIKNKTELIIIISPETMDFPLSLELATMQQSYAKHWNLEIKWVHEPATIHFVQ
jgi:hypothetical protein